MKYRHKYLIQGGPADGPQLPNVFHLHGTRDIDGTRYIGLLQEGQSVPAPTWFAEDTFSDLFEPLEENAA
jgi:hypothetical protein